MTPRYVVGSATDATVALRRLARAGWHTREGFALTENAWDIAEHLGQAIPELTHGHAFHDPIVTHLCTQQAGSW